MNIEEFASNYSKIPNFESSIKEFRRILDLPLDKLMEEFTVKYSSLSYMHLEAFAGFGEIAVDRLIAELQTADIDLGSKIISALSRIGGETAFNELLRVLNDPILCDNAFYELMNIGDERALPHLIHALENGKFYAMWGLADERMAEDEKFLSYINKHKQDTLLNLPKYLENSRLRRDLAQSLGLDPGNWGLKAIVTAYQDIGLSVPLAEPQKIYEDKRIVDNLMQKIRNVPEQVDFVPGYYAPFRHALARMGKVAFPSVIELLEDKDEANRDIALRILDEMDDKEAVLPVINYLEQYPNDNFITNELANEILNKLKTS